VKILFKIFGFLERFVGNESLPNVVSVTKKVTTRALVSWPVPSVGATTTEVIIRVHVHSRVLPTHHFISFNLSPVVIFKLLPFYVQAVVHFVSIINVQ
jgi:hypothetical protein